MPSAARRWYHVVHMVLGLLTLLGVVLWGILSGSGDRWSTFVSLPTAIWVVGILTGGLWLSFGPGVVLRAFGALFSTDRVIIPKAHAIYLLVFTRAYQLACSLGDSPGLPLPGNRLLRLNPDALFFLTIMAPGPTFQNFTGITSKSGYATGYVNIPGDKRLIGVTFYAAYVTLFATAPGGIHSYSTSKAVLIQ